MKRHWLTRGLPLLALLGLMAAPAFGYENESQDVQSLDGNPSPSASRSHVGDYRFQPDQLNLTEKSGLVKILRTDQKVLTNDYNVAVFPIHNANRRELRNVMRQITALEGGRAEQYASTTPGQSAWIEVTAPKFMMPYIKEAIEELDVPWLAEYNDGGFDSYYKVLHRDAASLQPIVDNYAGDTGVGADAATGYSVVDTYNNAIRHYGEEARQGEFKKMAVMADTPANQVLLSVKMYQVATNNDLKLGLDYVAWKNGPGSNLFNLLSEGYGDHPYRQSTNSNSGHWAYRAVNYSLPSSYVDFLQAKGLAKVITSSQLVLNSAVTGKISAKNAVVAHLSNTDEIGKALPASSSADVSASLQTYRNLLKAATSSGITAAELESYRQAVFDNVKSSASYSAGRTLNDSAVTDSDGDNVTTGIRVSLTPYIGTESMELDLSVSVRELNGYAPSGTPIINTRNVSTTVRMLDGQPLTIAGITKTNESKTTNKVPILGSIPVIGYVFGGEQDLKRKDDLVITITPTFCLSSQVTILKPPVIDAMEALFGGAQAQGAPDLKVGFDQYLIGG